MSTAEAATVIGKSIIRNKEQVPSFITTEAGKVSLIILINTCVKTANVKEGKVMIHMSNPTSLQLGFYNLYHITMHSKDIQEKQAKILTHQ